MRTSRTAADFERELRAVRTRRELSELVAAYRRPGVVTPEERDGLDGVSREVLRRFLAPGEKVDREGAKDVRRAGFRKWL